MKNYKILIKILIIVYKIKLLILLLLKIKINYLKICLIDLKTKHMIKKLN